MTTEPTMMARLQNLIGRLHSNQGGAIMLLLLAAFLVLFMVAMVIYDAGRAAQDKMDVQIAADSAAFSHSVVKSRTMNMITYANIIKRMIFSYTATYANAWAAILAEMAIRTARCFRLFPHIPSCIEWGLGLVMVISEGLEAGFTQIPTLIGYGGDNARSKQELNALERYQQYMYAITPWWAYVEGATRAMGNGAMISASWPPAGSVVSQIKQKASQILGAVDLVAGTDILGSFPSFTNNVDALPVVRRDRDELWSSSSAPFNFSIGNGGIVAAAQYCLEYAFSYEALLTGYETWKESYDHPKGWKTIFIGLQLVPAVGCAVASLAYNDDGYLDWKLKSDVIGEQESWLKGTASLHIAYKPRAGRNDNEEGRSKIRYLGDDYEASLNREIYGNEGYFAMARSELVYKQPLDVLGDGFLSGFKVPILDSKLGIQDAPDMWSPRWKSKNRPLILPGESFGSAVQGPDAGLNTVINDTIPFLVLGSMVGLVPVGQSEPFSIGSGVRDLAYLFRVGTTFTPAKLEGLSK